MALNDPTYRSQMVTSLYGSRLGFDKNGMVIGSPAHRLNSSTLGSTAVALEAHGISYLNAAAASTYVLDAPVPGVEKFLFQVGVGTSHNIITGTSNIKICSTFGSSQQRVALQSTGDWVRLIGLTTAQWGIVGMSAGTSVTT
jgi:hypothetical protein